MPIDAAEFYAETERLKRLNELLNSSSFFSERGYQTILDAPKELLSLSFPVFSPLNFLPEGSLKVLDIGCGAGLDMFLIKKQLPSAYVVGVDISLPLLRVNRVFSGCNIVKTTGEGLPFKEATFNTVIMNGSFNLIKQKEEFLKNIHKILMPQSCFFVADIFKKKEIDVPEDGNAFNLKGTLMLKELFMLFKAAGFSYENGIFDVAYTKEFGLFGVLWRRL
ncbi:MAG: hypothetical protein OHK0040_02530 [bacterium]